MVITDITSEGNGVGRIDGMAVFVPLTAVGDTVAVKIVKVNKNYAYGIIDKILIPSKDRIESNCEVFTKCGGCTFRHISYEAELATKDKLVRVAFIRIGKVNPEFEPILPCENRDFYRNKVQYTVAELNGKAVCGFYSRRSHRVVPFTSCRLQYEIFENIVNDIIDFVNENNIPAYNEETKKGIVRHIYLRRGYHSRELMVCVVVTDRKSVV